MKGTVRSKILFENQEIEGIKVFNSGLKNYFSSVYSYYSLYFTSFYFIEITSLSRKLYQSHYHTYNQSSKLWLVVF